jgi:hypothetical protein
LIRSLIKYLLAAIAILAPLLWLLLHFFGPSAEVRQAFAAWQTAYVKRDGAALTRLTSGEDIAFVDEQRRHALTSDRETVAALPFRQRTLILGLRAGVLRGGQPLDRLRNASPEELYAITRDFSPNAVADRSRMVLVAVIPSGLGTARGYVDLTGLAPGSFQAMLIPFFHGIRYDFHRTEEGWKVDPTPLLIVSANENEYWALMGDPTGNAMIFNMLGVTNPAEQEKYWQPLAP